MSVLYAPDELTTEELEQSRSQSNYNYSRSTDGISFDRMKAQLGYERAIVLEQIYQGEAELEEQKSKALEQANAVRGALVQYVSLSGDQAATMSDRGRCSHCGAKQYVSDACTCRFCTSCTQLYVSTRLHDYDDGMPVKDDCPRCAPLTEWPKSRGPLATTLTPLSMILGRPTWFQGDFWFVEVNDNEMVIAAAEAVPICDIFDEQRQVVLTVDQAKRLVDREGGEHEQFALALPEMLSSFLSDWREGLYPELEA